MTIPHRATQIPFPSKVPWLYTKMYYKRVDPPAVWDPQLNNPVGLHLKLLRIAPGDAPKVVA